MKQEYSNRLRFALLSGLVAICGLGLSSCNADHVSWSYSSGTQGTRVHVVVVDAPRDDVRAFYLTITEITFIAQDLTRTKVYSSREGHRVDLFALRRSAQGRPFDLATYGASLSADTYDRIRVSVKDPEIVLSTGQVVPSTAIDLVGSGTVERVLGKPIRPVDGETLYLMLDFDLESSLDHEPWLLRSWIYRPVLLVQCTSGHPPELTSSPVQVSGNIHGLNPSTGAFDLDLDGGRGVCDLTLGPGAPVMDSSSSVVPRGSVQDGMRAVVHAYLTPRGTLEARSVQLAESLQPTGVVFKNVVAPPGGSGELDEPEPLASSSTTHGDVLSVIASRGELHVLDVERTAHGLLVTPETEVLLLEEYPDLLRQTPVDVQSLRRGQRVRAVRESSEGTACRVLLIEGQR